MSGTDPFGLSDRDEATVIRPQPGGRGPIGTLDRARDERRIALDRSINTCESPLLIELRGLLSLAAELQSKTKPTSSADLRQRVEHEIKRFEDRARQAGLDHRVVESASRLICALIDDIVLNTPWGADGHWRQYMLSGTIHDNVAYDREVFRILDELRSQPSRNYDLLQLIYLCLTLGFEGHYRHSPAGQTTLSELRTELLALLGGNRRRRAFELSPDWQGVVQPYQPIDTYVPLWVIGVATLGVLGLIYTGFNLGLSPYRHQLDAVAANLPPTTQAELERVASVELTPDLADPAIVAPSPCNPSPVYRSSQSRH